MFKKGNFFGILLSVLLFTSIIALLFSEPQTTVFVVLEPQEQTLDLGKGVIEVKASCSGLPRGTCSKTKPLFCDNGDLTYNCYECGCNEGESCSDFGVCETLQKCADGSFYGECSFLNGKYCQDGTLIHNCDLCGCSDGKVCVDNKCVSE